MSKPTEDELKQALNKAIEMREQGQDPDFLAKALLNHHYRNRYLEEVMRAAEHYLHSGLAEREHTVLLRALDKARRSEDRTAMIERHELGLS